MGLLKYLRTADERAKDLLSDKDGFPDDLRGLVEHVSLEMLEEIAASRLGDLLLPSTVERLRNNRIKKVVNPPEPRKQLEVGIFVPLDDEDGIEEFTDEHSALRAAERTVESIHLRLLTRGEGKQETGTIKLITQALRIIGRVREMGADENADRIEQKLNRILAKF